MWAFHRLIICSKKKVYAEIRLLMLESGKSDNTVLIAENVRGACTLISSRQGITFFSVAPPINRLLLRPRMKRDAFRPTKLGPYESVARAWRRNDLMRLVGANFVFCFPILRRDRVSFPSAEFSNRYVLTSRAARFLALLPALLPVREID